MITPADSYAHNDESKCWIRICHADAVIVFQTDRTL